MGSLDIALPPLGDTTWYDWATDVHDMINALGHGGIITVGANNLSADQKRACTYVCDGTNDQVQINAAILEAYNTRDRPRGGVMLIGTRFDITAPIVVQANTSLRGMGWQTAIHDDGNDGIAMITNSTSGDNNILIQDLSLYGNYASGGSAHGIYMFGSSGGVDGTMNAYPSTHPDMCPQIRNVLVAEFRNGPTIRHGIWMGDNVRGARIDHVFVKGSSGHCIWMDGASDAKLSNVVTGGSGSAYAGYKVGGGSNQFSNCKAFYTDGVGYDVTSSRATMVLCQAQDCGTAGFNITGVDFIGTHLVADSCSRLSTTAYGIDVSASGAILNGVKALDRNQTPSSRQNRGIDVTGCSDLWITGMASTPTNTNIVNGTPTGTSYARIIRRNSTLYSVG